MSYVSKQLWIVFGVILVVLILAGVIIHWILGLF